MTRVYQTDPTIMGTRKNARKALLNHARRWRELRQPLMAPAKEQKRRDAEERETRFQLANAALLWLWHEEQAELERDTLLRDLRAYVQSDVECSEPGQDFGARAMLTRIDATLSEVTL